MKVSTPVVLVVAVLLAPPAASFSPQRIDGVGHYVRGCHQPRQGLHLSSSPWIGSNYNPMENQHNGKEEESNFGAFEKQDDSSQLTQGQANARFSKFAPDASLSDDDFRAQLKENMKADLERRRREDPNRGNQPAKSYLENL